MSDKTETITQKAEVLSGITIKIGDAKVASDVFVCVGKTTSVGYVTGKFVLHNGSKHTIQVHGGGMETTKVPPGQKCNGDIKGPLHCYGVPKE